MLAFDTPDLADKIDTPLRNYSDGMKMRLGFSIAIHLDPDILLVDEVLHGLGPEVAGVCHAIVSAALKRRVEAHCAGAGIPCLDLTGGAMKFLRAVTGAKPQADVRALHRLDLPPADRGDGLHAVSR